MGEARRRKLAGTYPKPDDPSTDAWRTQIDREDLAPFGVNEIHAVFFQPLDDRGGPRKCVMVQIPEASDQLNAAVVNARQMKARVGFLCDTREQADEIAERVGGMLPEHRRISFERAQAGGWGSLI